MYLACTDDCGKRRYRIRESYRHEDGYRFRDLFDLGAEPDRFIVYPGGNAFYIEPEVEEGIAAYGGQAGADDIEDIFWPFLRPDIRSKLEPFRDRERQRKSDRRPKGMTATAEAHIFDRRRVYFLKCGRMDLSSGFRIPASAARELQGKSRDEIEQGFLRMEAALRPRELKAYTFAVFNLQQFFHQRFAKEKPEFLDPEEVDGYFVEEACRLNRDQTFWRGMDPGDRLNAYLVRYLIMYFDNDYTPRSFAADYVRDFMNRHRAYRPPPAAPMGMEEAGRAFDMSREELQQMSRSELARRYRRRAQELHPDKGGDHEGFVKLTEAYHQLLQKKR
jgi:hypothetical protein